jgi:hypothetical protein
VLDELCRACDVTLVVPEDGNKRFTVEIEKIHWSGRVFRMATDRRRALLWSKYFLVDSLSYRKEKNFQSLRKFRRKAIGWKAALLFSILALPGLDLLSYAFYRGKLKKIPPQTLRDFMEKEKPDVLLHPSVLSGLFINDLVEVSKEKNIPLLVIMNSWDNPSTKKAMAGLPDRLLVWGTQTFQHARKFLQMEPEKILSFGAAQFDCFRRPPEFSPLRYRDLHHIQRNKKVILYAGSSRGSDEFDHLNILEEAIDSGMMEGVSIVYRPHPWGGGGKNGKRIVEKVWRHLRMEKSMESYLNMLRKGDPGITLPDYRHTHNTLSSVDLVISPLSTILIEAALHGVPSICLLAREEDAFGHHERNLDRFQEFFADPHFFFCESKEQLVEQAQKILSGAVPVPSSDIIRKNAEFYVQPFKEDYGTRLCRLIHQIKGRD